MIPIFLLYIYFNVSTVRNFLKSNPNNVQEMMAKKLESLDSVNDKTLLIADRRVNPAGIQVWTGQEVFDLRSVRKGCDLLEKHKSIAMMGRRSKMRAYTKCGIEYKEYPIDRFAIYVFNQK